MRIAIVIVIATTIAIAATAAQAGNMSPREKIAAISTATDQARSLLVSGDLNGALEVIELAYEETRSLRLRSVLSELRKMQPGDPITGSSSRESKEDMSADDF